MIYLGIAAIAVISWFIGFAMGVLGNRAARASEQVQIRYTDGQGSYRNERAALKALQAHADRIAEQSKQDVQAIKIIDGQIRDTIEANDL